ncbi:MULTISPECIES: hypothetical protein [Metabacillus]|jgi:hypothetical protein|uniref:Uncharacterized protein n=1 Tax=Metabacillus rhizolycopersici TaxID=2875709 RepID=A0ABS7UN45_9BACI|nr:MULTISPECIES: hypothetical protein [Metabacillus]MBZ5749365.1 hypothetical protein [Metabacillus rhizolycopersici]MCM3650590.1 hypothetical protein [Metabacillus litoralis]
MAFAIPSILGAIGLLFVQEKYGSYDQLDVSHNGEKEFEQGFGKKAL